MKNPFSSNAFYILGLPISASQSDIKKKARLVSAQLGIGEEGLDTDIPTIKAERDQSSVREAAHRLSIPLKKIQATYLWFSEENSSGLEKVLRDGSLKDAYDYLAEKAAANNKWNAKRDLAIFLTQLLFYKKSKKTHLKESLGLWKELISSDSAWKYFELYYKNNDDLDTDELTFGHLRKWADEAISDIYSELAEKWDDPEFARAYSKLFGKLGSNLRKNIFEPRAKEIIEAAKDLAMIKWHEKSLSKENLMVIKKKLTTIQNALNTLIEEGLYEDDEVLALRDKASDAIRDVAIDLTNKFSDFERSGKILAIAEQISGTQGNRIRNQNEKNIVEESRISQKVLLPVLELINKGLYLEAVKYLTDQINLHKKDSKIQKILKEQLPTVTSRYITERRGLALEKLTKGDFVGAVNILDELRPFIIKNLDLFDLVKDKVISLINEIDDKTRIVNKSVFEALGKERDAYVKSFSDQLGNTNSTLVIMSLLDCAYYVPLGRYLQKIALKNKRLETLINIGWLGVFFYGLGFLLLIPAYIWKAREVTYVRK